MEAPPTTLSKIETKEEETPPPIETPPPATEVKPEEEKRPTVEAAAPDAIKDPVDAKPPGGEPAKPLAEIEKTPAAESKPVVVEAKPSVEVKPPAEVKPPPEAKPAPAAETKPTPPVETKPALAGMKQEIIIEALDKVDISFKVNNGETRKVSLSPDQVHTIKASGIVAIEMSDGGAVNVIHNGRDVGVPGDLGRPKKIQFP